MQGRNIQSISRSYYMMPQFVVNKNITFFKHFRGYVRDLFIWADYLQLPIDYSEDSSYTDPKCLFYFKFLNKYNSVSSQLTNYCKVTNT